MESNLQEFLKVHDENRRYRMAINDSIFRTIAALSPLMEKSDAAFLRNKSVKCYYKCCAKMEKLYRKGVISQSIYLAYISIMAQEEVETQRQITKNAKGV